MLLLGCLVEAHDVTRKALLRPAHEFAAVPGVLLRQFFRLLRLQVEPQLRLMLLHDFVTYQLVVIFTDNMSYPLHLVYRRVVELHARIQLRLRPEGTIFLCLVVSAYTISNQ
jgi:hypothetical protein